MWSKLMAGFVTGQLATDPDDDSLPLPKGIEAQTRKVMNNLKRVLAGVGAGFEHVVSASTTTPSSTDFTPNTSSPTGYPLGPRWGSHIWPAPVSSKLI
jgi:enamine deaminase RidA (YjgF/YER057c/UK114 family)